MHPKISVIIASYNREKFIVQALQSMYQQTADKSIFEVIVVDNNSKDNTVTVCNTFIASHPTLSIQFIIEKQQGASFARNTGAALAKGEVLFFMDDDAIADPDLIEQTLIFYNSNKNINGWGGIITPKYIPAEPVWMSYYVSSLVGNFNYGKEQKPFEKNKYPLESNMAITKKAFMEVNGFNTSIPGVKGTLRIGGEGKELFFKIKALGPPIYYCPTMKVQHIVETQKLTNGYMYSVASGIGRGERVRMEQKNKLHVLWKFAEYLYKLAGSFVLGIFYTLKCTPKKAWPVIQFRLDVLKGFMDKAY
jgi:glucosyl-dolichyl phosphate glucuronosyltransferase